MCAHKYIYTNKSLPASEVHKVTSCRCRSQLDWSDESSGVWTWSVFTCLSVCESLYCLREQACLSVWRPTSVFTEQTDFSDFFLRTCSTFQEQMRCAVCLYWSVWLYMPSCVSLWGFLCVCSVGMWKPEHTSTQSVQHEPFCPRTQNTSTEWRCTGWDRWTPQMCVCAHGKILQRKKMCRSDSSPVPVAADWSQWWVRLWVLGTQNRPLYGEMMQTLIPLALWKAILGHYELSHASPTILRLVHLFVFYVFI